MTPLFAASFPGELTLLFVLLVVVVGYVVYEAGAAARAYRKLPVLMFDVVFPNGLRKWVHAKTSEDAVRLVMNDVNLKQDVVLYYPDGRIAGVVRPLGKGVLHPTWF